MKKVALLFGVDDYPQNKLKNAVNDVVGLSEKLIKLGFDVKTCLNPKVETMSRELSSFKLNLDDANVALFFFAGHGVQCKGENFLAAIDTSFVDESSCKYSAISMNMIIEYFEGSKVSTKIIILDACRDNPFVKWRTVSNDGLAPMYAPKGTIIAYSTSPGQKASDVSNSNNSVYTNALLMHIGAKKITIEDMFKRVRNTVSSHTNHTQITWEHTSLMGNFYFNSGYDESDLQTTYSENALADEYFVFESENPLKEIVSQLKTYNWYKQNPAISKLSKVKNLKMQAMPRDDLFILGRNIYQAACGNSASAIGWIDNIGSNLDNIRGNAAMHILNGILFEIYFSSKGRLRKRFKIGFFEKPIKLCQLEKYEKCSIFIRSFLEQYPNRIVYLPGTTEVMSVDVILEKYDGCLPSNSSNAKHQIVEIYVDGLASMYDEDGLKFITGNQLCVRTRISQFQSDFTDKIVVPTNKIKMTFNMPVNKDSMIGVPWNYQILRYV
ncbi:MAG: caspase family protein [Defluviitaleaceae bacterium]|nr:caspase family protein [Defluviitaleaceae bacterium]